MPARVTSESPHEIPPSAPKSTSLAAPAKKPKPSLARAQVESLEKKFGPAHRDVGAALNNLAQAYGNQGRDGEAEPLFKRARAVREKSPGAR
jgi:tetratricopeptide repeat protein